MRVDQIEALQSMVNAAKRIVFFGGAGVSTASGIPDFRSGNGLYAREFEGLTPEMILSQSFFYLHPDAFFRFYRTYMLHPDARTNVVHQKLAALEHAGKLSGLVTQNIDGLHRKAGNRLVYELHGSIYENSCIECGKIYGLDHILKAEGVPVCSACGCVVKPSVVLYGEGLDHYVTTGACREISRCDLLIVAGTSLTVYPAAGLINYYQGNRLVLINRDETPYDRHADLVFHESLGEIFSQL